MSFSNLLDSAVFRAALGIFAAGLLLLSGHFYIQAGKTSSELPDSTDFYKFYLSATRFNSGLNMYWQLPKRQSVGDPCHPSTPVPVARLHAGVPDDLRVGPSEDPCLGPNLNPPLLTAALSPLARLPFKTAWWIWSAASLFSGIVAINLISFTFLAHRYPRWLIGLVSCALLLTYYPTLTNFTLGQMGLFVFLLLSLAWRAAREGRPVAAAFCLGLTIALKPFFVILCAVLLLKGQARIGLSALVVAGGLTLLGWIYFGTNAYQTYMLIASDVTWNGANWNGSWAGLTERIFSGQADSILKQGSTEARVTAGILGAITFALTVWGTTRPNSSAQGYAPERTLTDLGFCLGIPLSLIMSPLGWVYYFPALTLSWAILAVNMIQNKLNRTWLWMLILSIALSAPTFVNKPSPRPEDATIWWSTDSMYLYTLVSLLIMSFSIYRQNKHH